MVGVEETRKFAWMLGAGLAALAVGCAGGGDSDGSGGGSGGGSFGVSTAPVLEMEYGGKKVNLVSPGLVQFNTGEAVVGGTVTQTVTVRNVGNGPLQMTVGFDYNRPPVVDDETSDAPALSLVAVRVGSEEMPITTTPTDTGVSQRAENVSIGVFGESGEEVEIVVQFQRYADSNTRQGTLSVESNTKDTSEQYVALLVENGSSFPVAEVNPTVVDFGQVNSGGSELRTLQVLNTGSSDLHIESVAFQGHPDFRLRWDGQEYEPDAAAPIVFKSDTSPGIVVAPKGVITFDVAFAPLTPSPADGKLIFTTNDPVKLQIPVNIQANTEGPVIAVNPKKVQFGGKLVGVKAQLPLEISSEGTADLVVTGIAFSEESNANFTLDFTGLPGFESGEGPSDENPLTIPINQRAAFNVVYVPSIENPLGDDGQPVFDVGLITVTSNAFNAELPVEVTGLGVTQECPTAVGLIQEGEQVIPQTNLHLFGDQSFAPAGAVASWKWEVQQPSGSASVFVPSDNFPNPTFEVNTAGEYIFKLNVWDEQGVQSCVPWEAKVLVIPDEAIHVELLWHTPNDVDETDEGPEAGSDVDLHFVHDAYAISGPDIDKDGKPDPWFDQPFDCFWFNAHPNWGSFDPSIDDDPGLDRDDTDGAGPENLNLNIPENTTYRVGVHYWSDHEYGKSLVTVRIYIYSNLVFEVQDVELVNHDMWDVATIEWPSGKVTLVQGDDGYRITPNYQNPFFFQPE